MDEYTQRYLARSSQRGARQSEEEAYTRRYLARRIGAAADRPERGQDFASWQKENRPSLHFASWQAQNRPELAAARTGERGDVGVDPYGTGAKPAAAGNTDTKSLPSGGGWRAAPGEG